MSMAAQVHCVGCGAAVTGRYCADCGERIEPHVGQFTPGITMTRFYDSVIIPEGARAAQPGRVAIETE